VVQGFLGAVGRFFSRAWKATKYQAARAGHYLGQRVGLVAPSTFQHGALQYSSRENVADPVTGVVGPTHYPGSTYFPQGRLRLHHNSGPEVSLAPPGHTIERHTHAGAGGAAKAAVRAADLAHRNPDGSWATPHSQAAYNAQMAHTFNPVAVGAPESVFEVFRDATGRRTGTHPSRGRPTAEPGIRDQYHLDALTQHAQAAEHNIDQMVHAHYGRVPTRAERRHATRNVPAITAAVTAHNTRLQRIYDDPYSLV
jgi:hypothetical protein